jgi:hypothetical protein
MQNFLGEIQRVKESLLQSHQAADDLVVQQHVVEDVDGGLARLLCVHGGLQKTEQAQPLQLVMQDLHAQVSHIQRSSHLMRYIAHKHLLDRQGILQICTYKII